MISFDAAQRNLIIISTFNRKELTGLTLDSISRNKQPWAGVLILDDASTDYTKEWLEQWGFPVIRHPQKMGTQEAARERFKRALNAPPGFGFFVTVDNDMLFAADFDSRMRGIWEAQPDRKCLLVSGYRSVTYDVLSEGLDHVRVMNVGGACLGFGRETAKFFSEMPVGAWDGYTKQATCICPKQSLAQHIGPHGVGHSGPTWDVAFDFVGEGRWQ